MVRDFTEATKERLTKEIDDINKSTWSPVTDAIGDMFLYAGKWLGILSLKEDMSNVESYQRQVLDMTDMTKKELQQIFDDVYDLDKGFKEYFSKLNEHESVYNEKLKYLYSMIQPDFSICAAGTIKAGVGAFNEQLKAIAGKVNKDFETELDWAAKEAAWESAKGFVSGVIRGAVDILTLPVSMVKNIATGNPLGIFTDTWSLIDDVFAVGSNAVGLTVLGIGYGISAITGNNEQKNLAIQYAEAYGGATGLTDVLEAEEEINGENKLIAGMKKVSELIDTASATVGLWGDAKGFFEDPSSMVDTKLGFKDKLGTLKKADMLEEYQKDYRKWQSLYRKMGKYTHYTTLKNISNGYEYLEPIWDLKDDVETFAENEVKTVTEKVNKWYKTFGDAYDTLEDWLDFSDYMYVV